MNPFRNSSLKSIVLKFTMVCIIGLSIVIVFKYIGSSTLRPGLGWGENVPSTPRHVKPTPLKEMLATVGKLEINLISGLWASANAGTAVAILNYEGWTYYLTNKHVVANMKGNDPEDHELEMLSISSPKTQSSITSYRHVRVRAFLVYEGKILDLAIIKVPGTFPIAKLTDQPPQLLDNITVIGAPYAVFPVITQGHITDFNLEILDQTQCMLLSVASGPGNSGSPIFLNDGTVAGIVFAGITKYPIISFALGIEAIRVFLKEAARTSGGRVFKPMIDAFPPSIEVPHSSRLLTLPYSYFGNK